MNWKAGYIQLFISQLTATSEQHTLTSRRVIAYLKENPKFWLSTKFSTYHGNRQRWRRTSYIRRERVKPQFFFVRIFSKLQEWNSLRVQKRSPIKQGSIFWNSIAYTPIIKSLLRLWFVVNWKPPSWSLTISIRALSALQRLHLPVYKLEER